jgi:hypothetical protein
MYGHKIDKLAEHSKAFAGKWPAKERIPGLTPDKILHIHEIK